MHIDSFGWSLNIILMICFVIALLVLMRKPKKTQRRKCEVMYLNTNRCFTLITI
ncbi:hypothetical protein F4694_001276 [Bacillus niacini]|uniref:Uncharacterized protein n=1 Tax=Neobacillus niacini TaxID=86668 RepID=A0A852T6Y7_9BACI|nr:hypothetical protein [Neobacillus niacini]